MKLKLLKRLAASAVEVRVFRLESGRARGSTAVVLAAFCLVCPLASPVPLCYTQKSGEGDCTSDSECCLKQSAERLTMITSLTVAKRGDELGTHATQEGCARCPLGFWASHWRAAVLACIGRAAFACP